MKLKHLVTAVAAALLAPVKRWHEAAFQLNAVVTTKSTAITNLDAAPRVKNSPLIAHGKLREYVGTVEVANGDSIASILKMVRVHSAWRPTSVKLYCDAVTSAAADIGLYDIPDNGGAAVDVDFFASAQSIASALSGTEVIYEAAAGPAVIENIEKAFWQLLGLSADPGKWYDVCLTLTAAATAAGTVSLKVQVVEN